MPKNLKNTVIESIHKAYFEEGLNTGDIEVLVMIATAARYECNYATAAIKQPCCTRRSCS